MFSEVIKLITTVDRVKKRPMNPQELEEVGLPPQHTPECLPTDPLGNWFEYRLHYRLRPTTRFFAFNLQLFGYRRGQGSYLIEDRAIGQPRRVERIGGIYKKNSLK